MNFLFYLNKKINSATFNSLATIKNTIDRLIRKAPIANNKRTYLILFSFMLITTQVFAVTSVEKIRIWPSPTKTRIVFDLSGQTNHSFSILTNPDRLLVDLTQTKLNITLPLQVNNSEILSAIRANIPDNPGDTRVVFDLKTKTKPIVFSLDPTPDDHYGFRLVVDLPHNKTVLPSINIKNKEIKHAKNTNVDNSSIKNEPQSNTTATITTTTKTIPISNENVIIAIDAGHGGKDPGAIGPGHTFEKNITLAVAKKFAEKVNTYPGMKAILIRSGDYFIPLPQRTEIARKHKAHALISIHADGFRQPKPSGASVFVLSTKRANTEIGRWLEKHEEQSELLGGGDVLSATDKDVYLSHTVLDLQFSNSQKVAYGLAKRTISDMNTMVKMHRKKPEYASLAVLKAPDIPSLLIELGFITNPKEEKLLKENKYQDKLASSMAKGIYTYFKSHPPEGTAFANPNKTENGIPIIIHIVRSGEHLSGIAAKYKVSIASIKQMNHLTSNVVKVGQKLKIAGH